MAHPPGTARRGSISPPRRREQPARSGAPVAQVAWRSIVLGVYVVLQQLEGNLVTPYVMRSQSDIPALLVLFAVFAGGTVGGVLWALVAIPLAGALQVLVLRVVAPAVRRWSGATERVQEPGGPGEGEAG